MTIFPGIAARLGRCRRMQVYRKVRLELESLSDADLADIGLRRYQLGHVARVKVLR